MLPLDFRPNSAIARHNLPFCDINRLEEEEDKRSYTVPDSEDELKHWWAKFNLQHKYSLYCMILATDIDENVALLIDKHRKELSDIAGDKCCFVYFRDIEKAKLLEPFHFTEHAKGVIQFIRIIGVQPNKLPCILFFERVTSGEFVYVGMENKTVPELMGFLRELFAFIYSQKEVSLSAVKKFKFSKQVEINREALGKNLMQICKEMVVDVIKSLYRLP